MDLKEEEINRESLYLADEMFFTGTAAEITPIKSVDRIIIGKGNRGPITKNQLLKVIEKSYLTSNVYIDTAIKKGYFRIIRNERDKRSIFILPSVITIKTFEGFIDRRDILYRGVK